MKKKKRIYRVIGPEGEELKVNSLREAVRSVKTYTNTKREWKVYYGNENIGVIDTHYEMFGFFTFNEAYSCFIWFDFIPTRRKLKDNEYYQIKNGRIQIEKKG